MVIDGKKAAYGQLNTKDRLLDLPDSILHHIISFLGTEEACRTTILSKRWAHIWSTGLILVFRPKFFVAKKGGVFVDGYMSSIMGLYNTETIERLVNFIETTMQRYSEKNLSIRNLILEYPTIDQEMSGRIDKWLEIALRNQVEVLSLSIIPEGSPSYNLLAMLFLAKSLIKLTLCRVRVPYYVNLELISLQSLVMTEVDVDEQMLKNIIMSCPLKILKLNKCSGLQNISIPCCSRLEWLDVTRSIPKAGTVLVDTSSLLHCTYFGYLEDDPLPVILTSASKKNLRDLRIFGVVITDDIFGKLVSELPLIEDMSFFSCIMPKKIRIASKTLKELGVHDCCGLINAVIDAPELDTFCYNGDLQLSSVINSQSKYNAYFHLNIANLDNRALVRIKNLLRRSKCCKILSIILSDANDVPQVEVDMEQLSKIRQYGDEPCYVQELKLSVSCSTSTSILGESECTALVDGLLWCCRPDILSLCIDIPFDNTVIRTLLEILQNKEEYWKHPLKRMEIEGTNCSLLFDNWELDLRLRLYW